MVATRVTKATTRKDREGFMRRGKRAPATPAQVILRGQRRQQLLGKMYELAAKHEEDLLALAKEEGRNIKWIRKMFNRKTVLASTRRKASPYNAFLWKRGKTFGTEDGVASGRGKLKLMNKELNDEYYALDKGDLDKIVKEYEQHRYDKAHVAHHSAPAQHADFDKTFKNLMDVATGLANRCGLMFFMFFANKDGTAFGSGKQGYSNDAAAFFPNSFDKTPEQLAEMFQGFAMSRKGRAGDKDMSSNVNALKKEVRRLMGQLFRQFERREKAKISYNPLQLLDRYSLKFFGWDNDDYPNPAKLCTAAELRKLLEGLEDGTYGYERVADDDIDAIRAQIIARAQHNGVTLEKQRKERSDKNKSRKAQQESSSEDEEE